ncbi:polyamine deacetylase HDAC10 [Diretmus argenteus]
MATALCYDEEMTKYKLLWVDPACEIEKPERLTVIRTALAMNGLDERCVSLRFPEATDAEILLVHSEEYLEAVKKTPYMTLEDLKEFTLQYGDVYFHPNIYHCAKVAVGATLKLVDSVMMGRVTNGMALVRPPGHHSMRSAASGFCVFNNVAIAARYAKQKYCLERVLIVDWDVHHGQGVQYCFEDDPSVVYFSWHRYEHQKFWPKLRESDYDNVGKEKGAGFNINVPWNKVGMENSDYLAVFFHVLLPVAYEFCPELVLVSAGFDAAIGDPEGEMCATPDIFAHLTHLLMNLAGGRLVAVLEGGYNLTSLAQSVCQTVQTLLGDPAPPPSELRGPCESALESIHCVRSAHKHYWACFKHTAHLPTSDLSTNRSEQEMGEEQTENKEISPEEMRQWRKSRVLLVYIGDGVVPTPFTEDGKTLMVQIGRKEPEGQESKYRVPLCLKKGCSDIPGFMQAVLGLLLPIGYEYNPSLVLLVRMPDSGVDESVWQQLTGLLQGLAQGCTLVVMQEKESESVALTSIPLMGKPAPSLGPLGAPLPEDVEALESQRRRLQADWKLLQTTAPYRVIQCPGGLAISVTFCQPDLLDDSSQRPSLVQAGSIIAAQLTWGLEEKGQ